MRSLRFDPASRLGFRLQRMWLTPAFRGFLRWGVPALMIAGTGGFYLSQPDVQRAATDLIAEAKASIQERPEFMVHLMSVSGASDVVSEAVRETLPIDLPTSSFDLDLEAMRLAVEALPAVKGATLRVRSGGVLEVGIVERVPRLVWRTRTGVALLDFDGVRVAALEARSDRPELPLVVGESADAVAAEALMVFAAAGPLEGRIRGLRRMGERRWDVILDRGQVIQLPEEAPVQALERVILLDQAQDLLERDITHVDLRNPRRPTLRVAQSSLEELHEIRGLGRGYLNDE